MGQLKENKILKSIASYLNVQNNAELEEVIKRKDTIIDDDKSGLIWTVLYLTKKKRSSLLGKSYEDEIVVRQWLEYASTHLSFISSLSSNDIQSILKEINAVLSDKVYLLSNTMTIADVVLYYMLYPVMSKLSLYDKECYIHLSRWFNHVQQDKRIRQSNSLLLFSRTLLYH
ncbi:eukaryotic translation elongation factor 1 epsilon-1 [Planococcus citri]|uniref:eukaryotic translation elongation factor 1 epsilon-1 n=1 Tax=Planococcus citri TaxID=170843 RepID=UPI0031F87B22